MKKVLLFILLILSPMLASADAVEIDGIWYNLVTKAQEAEVTKNPNGYYSSSIEIPTSVTYNDVKYSVTTIGEYAFKDCIEMTSVTIPNSVTSIGRNAFSGCSGLTSVAIGNSVTSIGNYAFYGCSGLTSVTIPNSMIYIGIEAFKNCNALTSVHISDLKVWCEIEFSDYYSNPLYYAHHLYMNGEEIKDLIIPNSVNSVKTYAFSDYSDLTSVTIPNSVTSIGSNAFSGCSGLTSVTIGNNVTSIGWSAFKDCSALTSVTIPNSVTSIGNEAFSGCTGLTTITIGNGVKRIDDNAFSQCPELTDVYCMVEEISSYWGWGDLYTDPSAFKDSYIQYATLHVPEASINSYKEIDPWKNFKNIIAIDGDIPEPPVTPEPPITPLCAKPTITYNNGEIVFSCDTEGVEFISEVTSKDVKMHNEGKIEISNIYQVSVYAKKEGYINSETVTMEIVGTGGKLGDLTGDGKVDVADHVKLSDIIMNQK